MQRVILVDKDDNEIGLGEKIRVHVEGRLHRAISVYIFNSKGQIMMQRRSQGVYHSGLLWSNTCCSNCYEGESAIGSAHRSLKGEMGFDCDIEERFSVIYKTAVSNGLTEHEYLHVFFGRHEDDPIVNREEVMDWKWMGVDELLEDISRNGERYSAWLRLLVKGRLVNEIREFLKTGK